MKSKAPIVIAFTAFALLLNASLTTSSSFAQTPTAPGSTTIKIDSPIADTSLPNGVQVVIGGWAVDPAGPNSGVDSVRVYLDGQMDAGGTLLGNATYPKPRPDVASSLGNPAFGNSGFDFLWTPTRLSPGQHRIYVYAHSIKNGWQFQSVNVTGARPGEGPGGYGPGSYGDSRYGSMMPPYGPQMPPPCMPGPSPLAPPLCPPGVLPAVTFPGPVPPPPPPIIAPRTTATVVIF
jgi:hypothetical protein